MYGIKHLIVSILFTFLIVAFGTAGYMIIEDWEMLDAFYMTVITMGTVGYGEVHEISNTGRLFTTVLIFFGVSYFVYVTSVVVQFMVEGKMRTILGRRILDKKINRLKDHYIVCGYGRIGRVLCKNLQKKPLGLVVIEKDRELIPLMDEDKVLYVSGDVMDEANLVKAGIKRAKGLVAVLSTDADNVFLVLTAKQLNPDLYVIARACHAKSKSKLRAAGADNIESPYENGGKSIAHMILRPAVTNFLNLAFSVERKDIQVEEILVAPSSTLANVMLKDSGIRQRFNLIIIAIKTSDDNMLFNPSFETVIKAEDTVIAVGEEANLKKLEDILNP